MDGVLKAFGNLGPARLFGALGLTAIVAAALFALVFRMGGEDKALLFSGIDLAEAGEITQRLDQANIPYELRGDGSSIYVPRSKVLSTRLLLSQDGLPSRGSVGYEIFDKQDALGATQFQQNINRLRALEGELARTIGSIKGVKSARVHLVLPEKRLFEENSEQPSASIVLQLGGAALTQGQVRAIRNLVASATPGLSASRVTIADDSGRLLATAEDDAGSAAAEATEERTASVESKLKNEVQSIVESVVGPGAARVQVTADIDFNRVTQTSQTYDPDGRVVRESSTSDDKSSERTDAANGAASAQRNLPDGTGKNGDATRGSDGARSEENIKYEISNTVKTEVLEGGRVKRLSVAVAVDGILTPAADKKSPPQWAPRSQADLDKITALVKSAVGFDEARGDKVEVVNVRFARDPELTAPAPTPGLLDAIDPMRAAEIAAALIASLAIVFFVLRPLVAGLVGGGGKKASPQAALPSSQTAVLAAPSQPDAIDEHIDIARIQGQVKASSVKRISDLIEESPEESAQIIRTWLADRD